MKASKEYRLFWAYAAVSFIGFIVCFLAGAILRNKNIVLSGFAFMLILPVFELFDMIFRTLRYAFYIIFYGEETEF